MTLNNRFESSNYHLIRDRYAKSEYLIDDSNYRYIMDLIHLYHENIYQFPDNDCVHALKINEGGDFIDCDISINRIIFE